MTHNTDAPDSTDNDSAYPYSLHNHINNKNNMNPNTYVPDFDAPDASDDDAVSPDSIILDSSLKRKIDPNSMLKPLFLNTVTDADADTYYASPKEINTAPRAPNATTTPDAASPTA